MDTKRVLVTLPVEENHVKRLPLGGNSGFGGLTG